MLKPTDTLFLFLPVPYWADRAAGREDSRVSHCLRLGVGSGRVGGLHSSSSLCVINLSRQSSCPSKSRAPSADVFRYHQLLDEIHQCYLDQREQLLSPSITSTITDLTNQNSKDHCALVRRDRFKADLPFRVSAVTFEHCRMGLAVPPGGGGGPCIFLWRAARTQACAHEKWG